MRFDLLVNPLDNKDDKKNTVYSISFEVDHYSEKDAEEIYQFARRLKIKSILESSQVYVEEHPRISSLYKKEIKKTDAFNL